MSLKIKNFDKVNLKMRRTSKTMRDDRARSSKSRKSTNKSPMKNVEPMPEKIEWKVPRDKPLAHEATLRTYLQRKQDQ